MTIAEAIKMLGLSGKPVCIHSSMRSFNCRIENFLDRFLSSGITVMVPAFSDMYEAPPVPEFMPPQNGAGDYSYFYEKEYVNAGVYSPESNLLSVEDMGKFSEMVLNHPERVRGDHPLNSFAAVGELAQQIVGSQDNMDVYAPLRELYDLDGFVLLMGTDLTTATAIHYAEQLSGRMPFVRWTRGERKNVAVRAGGCSDGFEKLSPMLKQCEKQLTVCGSLWRCYRIRELVDLCAEAFRRNPNIAHCDDPNCSRCNDAAKGGPLMEIS